MNTKFSTNNLKKNNIDVNLLGWESIATKWHAVKHPRRPSSNDLNKLQPLVQRLEGPVAIFGATPEYRFLLDKISKESKKTYNIYLIEKSILSYKAMNSILKKEFNLIPKKETLIEVDWEEFSYPKNTFSFLLGDTILGYLQTKDRLEKFLNNCHYCLTSGGSFFLREFLFNQSHTLNFSAKEVRHLPIDKDKKRWAYIFVKGFAIENSTFYEEKLSFNLLEKVHDVKVFKTCANPPRLRLVLDLINLEKISKSCGFNLIIHQQQENSLYPKPAILELKKY
ncbi:MAG: hypothetical protein N3D10_00505 [Candidatus Micrarchaeota archaeon]|nr:hypothetical protein [Candidatus Micrarchaeota archaeon]